MARSIDSPSTVPDGKQGYRHRCGGSRTLEFSFDCLSFVSQIGSRSTESEDGEDVLESKKRKESIKSHLGRWTDYGLG